MNQKEIKKEIFILLKKKSLHQRKLARILKTSQSNIRRAVSNLEKENILDHRNEGRNMVYLIKDSLESIIYERVVESYKLIKILKNSKIRRVVKEIYFRILKNQINSEEVIVLFGSYAKNMETKESDIDLYLKSNSKKVKELIEEISEEINVKQGKFDNGNLLLKEIVKDHIILNNVEGFLNLVK